MPIPRSVVNIIKNINLHSIDVKRRRKNLVALFEKNDKYAVKTDETEFLLTETEFHCLNECKVFPI